MPVNAPSTDRPVGPVEKLLPVPAGRWNALDHGAWRNVDPVLLELVRLRITTLIGHPGAGGRSGRLGDARIAQLPQWPTSDSFDRRERDCLAFAEQFIMDVGSVTDDQVAALGRHFDADGIHAFVTAVFVMDFGQRLDAVSSALLGDDS